MSVLPVSTHTSDVVNLQQHVAWSQSKLQLQHPAGILPQPGEPEATYRSWRVSPLASAPAGPARASPAAAPAPASAGPEPGPPAPPRGRSAVPSRPPGAGPQG